MIQNELKQQIVGVQSIIQSTICIVFKQAKNNSDVESTPTTFTWSPTQISMQIVIHEKKKIIQFLKNVFSKNIMF